MIGAIIAKSNTRKAFKALNNHDIETFMSLWHEDGSYTYPGNVSASGTHQGKDAVRSWFERFFQQFPEIQFTLNNICVDRIFDMTGKNTVITDWTIEYTNNSGTKVQNIGIDVVKISGGKVIEIRAFFFYPERLKDAWGET